jgi:competence protein ComEC
MPFNFPISRITVFFVLGIITFYYHRIPSYIVFLSLFISLFLTLYFLKKGNKNFKDNNIFGVCLYFLFFWIGVNTTLIHNSTNDKTHYFHDDLNFDKNHAFEFIIKEKLKNSKRYNRFIANVVRIDNNISSGKVLINLKKDLERVPIDVGSRIVINNRLVKNFKPKNPNQFDHSKYMETKGIYAQLFVNAKEIKICKKIEKDLWFYASHFRNKMIGKLSENGFKKEELAVVNALILGQQQDISPEIMRDYQYAGAIHILSVSGLHVGFIVLLINFILRPFPKNKLGNLIRLIVTIVLLWVFGLLSGMSPSVIRSVTMFSFISVGIYMNRQTDMYHNLLISIFVILLFQPLYIFDIGFQLSYVAVFFILWMEQLLKSIWKPKSRIINYFWSILTVSFAAQIGTLPLSIYYFHQFPGLFFVTNLVLIPCLTIIMSIGLLLLILSAFNFAPHYLLKSVEISITLMNRFINQIASVESFVIKDIPLGFWLLITLYLVIISWIVLLKKPNVTKLFFALECLMMFQITLLYSKYSNELKKEWLVLNVSKKTIIIERNGQKAKVLTNQLLEKSDFEQKMISDYITAHYCKIKETKRIPNVILFNKKRILVIDDKKIYQTTLKPDILLLINSPKINLERVANELKPKLIIADGSNYKAQINLWESTCMKRKIPFHSTNKKGYYILE